jgi:hypothetical protein
MLNALRLKIHTSLRNPQTKQRLGYVVIGTAGLSIIAYAVGYTGYVIPILGVVIAVIVIYRNKPVEERKRIAPRQPLPSRIKQPVKPQPPSFFTTFVDVIEGDMRNVLKRFRKREKPVVVVEVPKESPDDSWYWME